MLKKVLLMSMALLVGINTVNACEVEQKGLIIKGRSLQTSSPVCKIIAQFIKNIES